MLDSGKAYGLIQEVLSSLSESGMIPLPLSLDEQTVLLGEGSPLDSMGFVTMVTELEDRLSRLTGKEIFFVLDDVKDFKMNQPFLTAKTVANHLLQLAGTA